MTTYSPSRVRGGEADGRIPYVEAKTDPRLVEAMAGSIDQFQEPDRSRNV